MWRGVPGRGGGRGAQGGERRARRGALDPDVGAGRNGNGLPRWPARGAGGGAVSGRGRAPGWAGACEDTDAVGEDAGDDRRVGEDGHDAHRRGTPPAREGVDLVDAPQQRRPAVARGAQGPVHRINDRDGLLDREAVGGQRPGTLTPTGLRVPCWPRVRISGPVHSHSPERHARPRPTHTRGTRTGAWKRASAREAGSRSSPGRCKARRPLATGASPAPRLYSVTASGRPRAREISSSIVL